MRRNLMQLGRSMVEMLGVLAIIGVLSIVGIQGYKKAMNKHKANEAMDLAIKVWNEAQTKHTLYPTYIGVDCRVYLRENGTENSTGRSLNWDRPSWASSAFNIMASQCPVGTIAPMIVFYYTPEEICNELKTMTKESDIAHYRLLNNIYVACTTKSNPTDSGSCF